VGGAAFALGKGAVGKGLNVLGAAAGAIGLKKLGNAVSTDDKEDVPNARVNMSMTQMPKETGKWRAGRLKTGQRPFFSIVCIIFAARVNMSMTQMPKETGKCACVHVSGVTVAHLAVK
jgi:hypothetical protein